jgi:hypothetical protein
VTEYDDEGPPRTEPWPQKVLDALREPAVQPSAPCAKCGIDVAVACVWKGEEGCQLTQPAAPEGRWRQEGVGWWRTGRLVYHPIASVRSWECATEEDAQRCIGLLNRSEAADQYSYEALEAERDALCAKLAGWLMAACRNCGLILWQPEPGLWLHGYGPMIGRAQCNQEHGAESDKAAPDDRYYERVASAFSPAPRTD